MCCSSKDNLNSDDEMWHPSMKRGREHSEFSVRDNTDLNRPSYNNDLRSPRKPRGQRSRSSRKAPNRGSAVELPPAVRRDGLGEERLRVDSRDDRLRVNSGRSDRLRSDKSRSDRSRNFSGRSRTISYQQSPNHLRVRGVSTMTNASQATNASQGYVPQLPYIKPSGSIAASPIQHSFNTTPSLLGASSSRYRQTSVMSNQTDQSMISNDTMSPSRGPYYNDGGFVPQAKRVHSGPKYTYAKHSSAPQRPKQRDQRGRAAPRGVPFTGQRRASTQQQQSGERSSSKYTSGDNMYMSTDNQADGVKWHRVKLLGYFPKSREWKIQFSDRSTMNIVEQALHDDKSYRVLSNNSYTVPASEYGSHNSRGTSAGSMLNRGSAL